MTLVKEAKYILSNIGNNNNKFWYIELYDDASTITRNGRVGAKGQTHPKQHGSMSAAQSFFSAKCNEKEAKGYQPLNVVGVQAGEGVQVQPVGNIKQIAKQQIRTNDTLVGKLIEYFTKVNAHNICSATGGQITFNNQTGLFSTPLGIVTQANINDANALLVRIGDKVAGSEYDYEMEGLTNDYMMLVPQDVGMRRVNVGSFWGSLSAVQRQKGIVDSLEASLSQATQEPVEDKASKTETEQVFDVQLDLVTDTKVIGEVKKLYQGSKNNKHNCSHLRVKTVYAVQIATEQAAFEAKGKTLGNIQRLWHGTRASNVLSILKQGLVIPPSSSSHCTGRAFGDGLYFSDQSTKSLNYSYGYWGGGKADNNCFMFLADVAMGKEHIPSARAWGGNYPARGSNSTFAKAGDRFMNNEMIVYRTFQANLKYLVEFTD